MKQGMSSINEVAETLYRLERTKRDFIAPSSEMRMMEDGSTITFGDNSFGASGLFHSQLGTSLGIPAKYYGTMRQQKPELLAENVNAWLGSRGTSHMIRTIDYGDGKGQTARAFLSDRYRRIDNIEIANAVLPMLTAFQMASCAVTENNFYIKAVNPRIEREVVPGDIVQFGVSIKNSEVGQGGVVVCPLVFRLVCSNGAVVNKLGTHKRHVGRVLSEGEEDFSIYSDETILAEKNAFMMRLRDSVSYAVEETLVDRVVEQMQESTQRKITGKVLGVVELTSKDFGFNQIEQDSILKHLIEGGDMSQYGLSNAVTRASQDVESYDRATYLETAGWNVITLNDKEWRVLNKAA